MARVQVRIEIYARRQDLSSVNIVPLDPQNPVKQSQWRGRTHLWPQKAGDAILVVKDDSYVVVVEEGRLIVVYGYAADSRKYGEYYAAVLRAKAGAKAEGERVGAENAELLAEAVGGKIDDIVAEMAVEGYAAASSQSTKRAANVAAYLAMKALQQREEQAKEERAEEQKEAQQSTPAEERTEERAEEQHSEEEEDELLREIEEARRRLAALGAEEQQKPGTPAEQQKAEAEERAEKPAKESEERKEQQEAEEQEKPSPFANGDYIVFVNGHPYVRLWLVKAHKVSEYLGSRQQTKANGKGELEIVKKLAPWASKIETARRKMNELLAGSIYVWRGDGYFGYNTSIRIVLSPLGLRELAQAYAIARGWVLTELRHAKAPKEVVEYVEREFKPRPVPMLVPLEAAIAILRAIHAWYVFSEIPRVKQKLREHQQRQNKKMAKKLEQELEALEKQLRALEEALKQLEQRVQSA